MCPQPRVVRPGGIGSNPRWRLGECAGYYNQNLTSPRRVTLRGAGPHASTAFRHGVGHMSRLRRSRKRGGRLKKRPYCLACKFPLRLCASFPIVNAYCRDGQLSLRLRASFPIISDGQFLLRLRASFPIISGGPVLPCRSIPPVLSMNCREYLLTLPNDENEQQSFYGCGCYAGRNRRRRGACDTY